MLREYKEASLRSESRAGASTGRESAGATSLVDISPGVHPAIISRWMGSCSSSAAGPFLQLQRQLGNRYVQRLMESTLVQRDDDNASQQTPGKPPPVVGPGGPVDPNDKGFSVQWNLDPFSPVPSGIQIDPGHGDPLKYPGDEPSATPGSSPLQGIVRPPGCPEERWVPPGPNNGQIGYCRQPAPPPALPVPAPPPPPEPGDYNVPDQDSNVAVA